MARCNIYTLKPVGALASRARDAQRIGSQTRRTSVWDPAHISRAPCTPSTSACRRYRLDDSQLRCCFPLCTTCCRDGRIPLSSAMNWSASVHLLRVDEAHPTRSLWSSVGMAQQRLRLLKDSRKSRMQRLAGFGSAPMTNLVGDSTNTGKVTEPGRPHDQHCRSATAVLARFSYRSAPLRVK
jgi:hypothetical protein